MNLGPMDASEMAVLYPEHQVDSEHSMFSQIVDLPVVVDDRGVSTEAQTTLANIQLTQLEAGNPGAVARPLYQAPMENPLLSFLNMTKFAGHTKMSSAFEKVAIKANKPMTPPGLLRAPGYLAKQSALPSSYLPFHPGIVDLQTGRSPGKYFIPDAANKVVGSVRAIAVRKPKLFEWVPDRFFPKFEPHPINTMHPMLKMGL